MADEYRWIVTVQGIRKPYAREVTTEGPRPQEAITKALELIERADNDLWQANNLTATAERVR